ncbi:LysR family transcriptional regulator [Endozoicomonas sp. OPT23]|uniref:LysR family transcriptional regulator n=1 Tax=Endozoicomonas sp. OPT23 TaxID=2072845 RepID=UPI00129AAD94|nr:LysR family transcriptional regulator [Endozoicomonas sp. OPT23]MRI34902.1 LysR family transcriptional regulator [Endozoicomonas sp. OPT23]
MDKLNLLRIFVSVVNHGSFARASVMLGMSPSTVSKAIGRLENSLNLLLFHRTTRQLTLTEHGQIYVATARQILGQLEQCEDELKSSNDAPKGCLRINMPVSYGRLYVLPLLGEFCERYPDITLNISFDDSYVDVIHQNVDIAIRSGTLAESSFVARQLSPIDYITCCSPDFFQKNLINRDRVSLKQQKWVCFRFRQSGRVLPVFFQEGDQDIQKFEPPSPLIVDDGEAMAELCAQGYGLSQLPHFIARDWLKSGKIIPITHFHRPDDHGVWMVYARRNFLPSRIRAFVNFLQDKIQSQGETPRSTWAEKLVLSERME